MSNGTEAWGSPWAPSEPVPDLPALALKIPYLELIDVFGDLPREEIARMARELTMHSFHAGGIIYGPGDPGDTLFLLKHGRVQIVQDAARGKRLVIATLHPYTFFGEMALVGQRFPVHATAEALDEVLVCLMRRADIERLFGH